MVFAWVLAITLGGWVFHSLVAPTSPWRPEECFCTDRVDHWACGVLQMRLNDKFKDDTWDAAYTDRICCVDRSALGNMGN
jgi:hypothetical protein